MLSKLHRFHGSVSLRYVFKRGDVVRQPDIALKYTVNNRSKQYRVAVIVSKKVHKSAVKRNLIRRRIYSVVSEYQTYLNQPYDLVFFVYKDKILDLPHPELKRQIAKLLKQANIT